MKTILCSPLRRARPVTTAEKKLVDLATQRGQGTDDLVQDLVAASVEGVADIRVMLDSRYDDLKSGRVKPIDGEEAFTRLREKSEQRRNGPA